MTTTSIYIKQRQQQQMYPESIRRRKKQLTIDIIINENKKKRQKKIMNFFIAAKCKRWIDRLIDELINFLFQISINLYFQPCFHLTLFNGHEKQRFEYKQIYQLFFVCFFKSSIVKL